jgi:hypothetical protein
VVLMSAWPSSICTTRVAQHVGREWNVDVGQRRVFLDDKPERLSGHGCSPACDEEGVAVAGAQQGGAGGFQVAVYPVLGFIPHGHEPVFAALAHIDPHHALVQAHIEQVEADEFADAQAGGIEGFQHGAVAQAQGAVFIGGMQQVVNLVFGQCLGKARGLFGGMQAEAGVTFDQPMPQRP